MTPAIRVAEAEDVPSLEIVRRQAIEAGFEAVYDRAEFAPLVASPNASLTEWVATDDYLALAVETEVTVAAFGVYDSGARDVRALFTAPAYQRQGFASAVLDRFEARARDDGAEEISVEAPRNAVQFFEARGFTRRGTAEREGLPVVRMAKRFD